MNDKSRLVTTGEATDNNKLITDYPSSPNVFVVKVDKSTTIRSLVADVHASGKPANGYEKIVTPLNGSGKRENRFVQNDFIYITQ